MKATIGILACSTLGLLAGCASGTNSAVMSWDEYRRTEHLTPYVLDLSIGHGRLVYVGARHTNDPTSSEVSLIEWLWTQLEPELAFNEGGDPPTEKTKVAAVRRFGEAGLVRYLAMRDGVSVASLDPSRAQQADAAMLHFSAEQVKTFFALLQVYHHRENPIEPFDERMTRVFRNLEAVPTLTGRPRSLGELDTIYKEQFPGQGDYRDVPTSWFNPTKSETSLNDIARRLSEYRDGYIVQLLTSEVLDGKRVFAVVGASHVVMQEKAIRSRLKKGPV